MMRAVAIVCVALVLLSALVLVFVRHQGRIAFVELQQLNRERDRLNEQWSKLLLEQATWSGRRIERKARTELRLESPGSEQIRIIVAGQR